MHKAALLGPRLDALALGGLTLLVLGALRAAPSLGSFTSMPAAVLALNALFSYPHIMASYAYFYGKGGPWRRRPLAAFVVPAATAALLAAVRVETAAQLALPLLYWHFLRQAVGASLWLRGPEPKGRGTFRAAAVASAWALGVVGYLSLHAAHATGNVFTLSLEPLKLPRGTATLLYDAGPLALGVAVLGTLWGARSAPLAVLPLAALWCWFDPRFTLSPLYVLLPVLHGVQYLAFCLRARLTSLKAATAGKAAAGVAASWAALAAAGLLFFQWLPRGLGAERMVAAFAVFLNVHHYFIDTVLWRMKEPEARARLGL